jgi:hypothetical protein
MTIEQTINIPANREVTIRLVVPETVPCGKQAVILDFPAAPSLVERKKPPLAQTMAEIWELCKDVPISVDSFLEERHAERDREYEDIE